MALKQWNLDMSFEKNQLIDRDFKNQTLFINRCTVTKKASIQNCKVFLKYLHLKCKCLVLTNFIQSKLKAVMIIDLKCKDLEEYIVIGESFRC